MRIFSKSIWFVFIVGRQRSHDAKSNFLFPFIASLSKPRDNRAAFFVRSFAAIPIYKIKAPEKIRGFGQNILFIMVVSKGLEPSTSCMWSMRSNQLSYETVSFSKIFFIYNVVSISLFLKLVNLFIEKIFPFSNFLLRKALAFPKRKNLLWNHLKSLVLFAEIYYHYKW